ncbi:MAG: T9SS type A sorting domain-containing protein [Flavobacteriales bacterium]|nr:MAG: T9SS type A sorting domain-containing protein [Flavobacteriales bacterium]
MSPSRLASLLLLLSASYAHRAPAQGYTWASSGGVAGIANSFSGALDLARDPQGNLFLFNDGSGAQQCQGDTVSPSGGAGSSNAFVHKFNSAGELQWIRPVGPQFQPFSIRADEAGNAYFLGRTLENAIIVGDTTVNATAARNYLLKFSPDGDLVWAHNTGMPLTGGFSRTTLLHYANGLLYFQSGNLSMTSIDTAGTPMASLAATSYVPQTALPNLWFKNSVSLSNGDVIITGEHRGELAFGTDPSQPGDATAAALNRYFFLRCSADLDSIRWFRSHGNFRDRFEHNIPLVVDPADNIYACATLGFNTPIAFGPDVITNTTLGNGIDAVLKMDADGTPLWMRPINSTASTYAYGLVLKDDGNSLYLCGQQTGSTATFGPAVITASATGKGFIAEISAAGDYLTGFHTGVPAQPPNALQSFAYALVSQGDGRYVVSGQLNTLSPWELSCVERIPNRGFFVTEFTGISEEVPDPQISQVGSTLIASPAFAGTIQWLLNGEPILGANGQSYEPTENGSYRVSYTNTQGCVGTATSDGLVVTTTGLAGTTATATSLEAWPNPTGATLFLRGLPASATVSIAIVDAMGRKVSTQNAVGPNAHIDTTALPGGVYWLRVGDGAGQQVLRFVKH